MFDKLKAAGQLAGMLKDLPKLQGLVEDVRTRLASTRVEGSAGGGAVRAVAFCDIRIDTVTLDPSVFHGIAGGSAADQSYANRLIAEAVNDGLAKGKERMAEALRKEAKDLGLDDLPFDISKLLS